MFDEKEVRVIVLFTTYAFEHVVSTNLFSRFWGDDKAKMFDMVEQIGRHIAAVPRELYSVQSMRDNVEHVIQKVAEEWCNNVRYEMGDDTRWIEDAEFVVASILAPYVVIPKAVTA